MKDGPDRQRAKELDCLEISVISGRAAPLVLGVFKISVSIYKGCSVPPDTSNYRTPKEKMARSTAGKGTTLSGNASCLWVAHAVSFRYLPDTSGHLEGRFGFA